MPPKKRNASKSGRSSILHFFKKPRTYASVVSGIVDTTYASVVSGIVDTKTEKERLQDNLTALGLKKMSDVPGDGSCFFHSMVAQFGKLGIDRYNSRHPAVKALQLRRDAVQLVQDLDPNDPIKEELSITGQLANGEIENMKHPDTYAEQWVIQATAQLLGRDIHIVNSDDKSDRPNSRATVMSCGIPENGDPFLVGYLPLASHYIPLEPVPKKTGDATALGGAMATLSDDGPISAEVTGTAQAGDGATTLDDGQLVPDGHDEGVILAGDGADNGVPLGTSDAVTVADDGPQSVTLSDYGAYVGQLTAKAIDGATLLSNGATSSDDGEPVPDGHDEGVTLADDEVENGVPAVASNIDKAADDGSSLVSDVVKVPADDVLASDIEAAQVASDGEPVSDDGGTVASDELSGGQDDEGVMYGISVDDKPCQPQSGEYDFPQSQKGDQKMRRFQASWFRRWPWLHYDKSSDCAYCFVCLKCHHLGLLPQSVKPEPAFTKSGFQNWKKATGEKKGKKKGGKFSEHEGSRYHKLATQCLATKNIVTSMNSSHRQDQEKSRMALLAIITTLKFLARQGLSIRGHEESGGNFKEMLKLRALDIPALATWLAREQLRKRHWMSHDIQNEMLRIMAHRVLNNVISDIRDSQWFSLIVDETTDISTSEQVSICIRYIKDFEPIEAFLGLYQTSDTTGNTLFRIIEDVLLRFQLDITRCRGQCYDGAKNMSGRFNGVQAKLKEKEPRALYVHCTNHSLNLAVQEGASVPLIRDALELVHEIGKLMKGSPKRKGLFEKIQSESSESTRTVKPLCPTRWTVKSKAIKAVLEKYDAIINTLESISADNKDVAAPTARGLAQQLGKTVTYFALLVADEIFGITDELACVLQSPTMTVSGALESTQTIQKKITTARSDHHFFKLWNEAQKNATLLDLEPPLLPRVRKPPNQHENNPESTAHTFTSVEDFYKKQYFEFLDMCSNQITSRFDQPDFKIFNTLETLLLSAATNKDYNSEFEGICNFFKEDINRQRLHHQLSLLSCLPEMTVVQNMTDMVEAFANLHNDTKQLLSELKTLLQIHLTIPASAASAERSFSSLRRLKTWLRSTIGQNRLNHLSVLHAHKDHVDAVNVKGIAEEFVSRIPSRRDVFGRF